MLESRGVVSESVGHKDLTIALACMTCVRSFSARCRACVGFFKLLFKSVAGVIDSKLNAGYYSVSTPSSVTSDRKRRSRVNESFKQAVVGTAVQQRRARNGETLLRTLDVSVEASARHWARAEMLALAAVGKRMIRNLWNSPLVVGISSDAARLGNPPEETVAYNVWFPALNAGAVGVPQA